VRKRISIDHLQFSSKKEKWNEIIFGADTKEGWQFDIALLIAIVLSVLAIMAESVPRIDAEYAFTLSVIEVCFTILFTIEYGVRVYVSEKPRKYIFSFWGVIDLVSTLPTYLALFVHGPQVFTILRIVRLLRVFRVLRLTSFLIEAKGLGRAIQRSSAKITVFFGVVMIIVVVMGTLMYSIESPEAGFTSIPRSIYWAIVTLTTVGYGDIAPVTSMGQFLSAMLMILGYAVIAVPTGVVSVEMSKIDRVVGICENCGHTENEVGSEYCRECGTKLSKPKTTT
jgi:voltage-gated potassium channel